MPPLRERPEDIPDLCRQFVERYNGRFKKAVEGVSDSAIKLLSSHWWPDNIRELENLIERRNHVGRHPEQTRSPLPGDEKEHQERDARNDAPWRNGFPHCRIPAGLSGRPRHFTN